MNWRVLGLTIAFIGCFSGVAVAVPLTLEGEAIQGGMMLGFG